MVGRKEKGIAESPAVSESNLPALVSLLPPNGIVSLTVGDNPILTISRDLCKIAAFLQQNDRNAKLIRIDDWWEHDGLWFDKGVVDFHTLFQTVGTPRSLAQAMPGDDRVFVGIAASDRLWYLRFFVDWDDNDEMLLGKYSITLDSSLAQQFATYVTRRLECPTRLEESAVYFARIRA
jgi:hypothetical protein